MASHAHPRPEAAPPSRVYLRPAADESFEDFGERAKNAFLAMIAQYRCEHPDDADAPQPLSERDREARERGRRRLESLRRARSRPDA